MMRRLTVSSPAGPLTLSENDGSLVGIAFRDDGATTARLCWTARRGSWRSISRAAAAISTCR